MLQNQTVEHARLHRQAGRPCRWAQGDDEAQHGLGPPVEVLHQLPEVLEHQVGHGATIGIAEARPLTSGGRLAVGPRERPEEREHVRVHLLLARHERLEPVAHRWIERERGAHAGDLGDVGRGEFAGCREDDQLLQACRI